MPLEKLRAMSDTARAHGVRVHLDGARLWNAAVASGVSVAEWAACADTAMMCFSKGLGAPVGSILVGGEAEIREARRVRKRWGGGMRQAGILAAACLHALDHHVARLADDHVRAKRLAAGMRMDGVEVGEPDTNIVIARLAAPLDPAKVLAELEKRGVRMVGFGAGRIRAICHLDVDDVGVESAIGAFGEAVRSSR